MRLTLWCLLWAGIATLCGLAVLASGGLQVLEGE